MNELKIPGYQEIAIEVVPDMHFLYIGDNYVVLNDEQWKQFQKMVAES